MGHIMLKLYIGLTNELKASVIPPKTSFSNPTSIFQNQMLSLVRRIASDHSRHLPQFLHKKVEGKRIFLAFDGFAISMDLIFWKSFVPLAKIRPS